MDNGKAGGPLADPKLIVRAIPTTGRLGTRQGRLLDSTGHIPRQIVSCAQVAAEKANVPIYDSFQNNLTLARAELGPNVQFGSTGHGCDGTSSLTAGCVVLHRGFQNQKVGNVRGVTIAAAEHLFEVLGLG